MQQRGLLLTSLFLFCVVAFSLPAKAQKGGQASYQSIFKDFYDLATPHNRNKDFSFGLSAQFATVVPLGRLGNTMKTNGGVVSSTYSTYFNFQARLFMRVLYYMEVYFLSGANEINTDIPISSTSYQHASVFAIPVLLGFKYRILKGDMVPYIFVAGGIYIADLKASEEGTAESASKSKNAMGFQAGAGMEIFIQPEFGLGFEIGIEQINHGTETFGGGGSVFSQGDYTFKSSSTGVLITSNFFYEF